MAKVIMICGRLCSGKSTYAAALKKQLGAAVLSVDEIMLALFGQHAGEKHDEYTAKLKEYLFGKAAELCGDGINVILDWGFWTSSDRAYAKRFFDSLGIENELHYIEISDEEWRRRVEKRNAAVKDGGGAYYVDDALAKKFGAKFEPPDSEEIDVRVEV